MWAAREKRAQRASLEHATHSLNSIAIFLCFTTNANIFLPPVLSIQELQTSVLYKDTSIISDTHLLGFEYQNKQMIFTYFYRLRPDLAASAPKVRVVAYSNSQLIHPPPSSGGPSLPGSTVAHSSPQHKRRHLHVNLTTWWNDPVRVYGIVDLSDNRIPHPSHMTSDDEEVYPVFCRQPEGSPPPPHPSTLPLPYMPIACYKSNHRPC